MVSTSREEVRPEVAQQKSLKNCCRGWKEKNRGDGSWRVSSEWLGWLSKRGMASRSKDDFSLDSPFIEQIVGRERRERVSQLDSSGDAWMNSRRRVNSSVRRYPLIIATTRIMTPSPH